MMYVITFIAGMIVGACALICLACAIMSNSDDDFEIYEETMNNFTAYNEEEGGSL